MSNIPASETKNSDSAITRTDVPYLPKNGLWDAFSRSPGIGVSIIDTNGQLLFVNDTSCALFFETLEVDYVGKTLSDLHPPEFAIERHEVIRRSIQHNKPIHMSHVYHGRRIESTIWPILDKKPPFDRVIVISNRGAFDIELDQGASNIEHYSTKHIELGTLDVLSNRELEVLVLLGHGQNVPEIAAMLHRSPKTIQRHKAAISEKLHLHGQAELVKLVSKLGLELEDCNLKRMSKKDTTR